MKKQRVVLDKKLFLEKETISTLSDNDKRVIVGGNTDDHLCLSVGPTACFNQTGSCVCQGTNGPVTGPCVC